MKLSAVFAASVLISSSLLASLVTPKGAVLNMAR